MNGITSRKPTLISSQASSACPTTSSTPSIRLRVALASGETWSLSLPEQDGDLKQLRDPSFQVRIRGCTLVHEGHSYALCAPKAFRRVLYNVELVMDQAPGQLDIVPPAAIRVSYVADMIMASMTLYLRGNPPMVRFDVRQTGKMRWQAP